MKKIICFGLLAAIGSTYAMDVDSDNDLHSFAAMNIKQMREITSESDDGEYRIIMPSEQVLKYRLCEMGLDHFVEKTRIHERLAGKTLIPIGVVVALEAYLDEYNRYTQQPDTKLAFEKIKSKILKSLLQDHPKTIEELKKDGLIFSEEYAPNLHK